MVAPVYVLYRTEKGDFAKAVPLKTDDGMHIVAIDMDRSKVTERICIHPCAHDLDGDGDLDFVIGNFLGRFLQVTNVGTKTEPAFRGAPRYLTNGGGRPLQVRNGNHGAPVLVDWDGDGDVDLLTGSGAGGVQIAENDPAEDGTPRFADFRALIDAPRRAKHGLQPRGGASALGTSWRIAVADWNADGNLDVIVGDCVRQMLPKRGDTVEAAGALLAEWQKGLGELNETMRTLSREVQTAEAEEARDAAMKTMKEHQAQFQEYYALRRQLVDEVATGHVWVYLRK